MDECWRRVRVFAGGRALYGRDGRALWLGAHSGTTPKNGGLYSVKCNFGFAKGFKNGIFELTPFFGVVEL
jgi:hypothetical protein